MHVFTVNTRLTESYSFPIAGWEAEVGSAGCLNDSMPQPPAAASLSWVARSPFILTQNMVLHSISSFHGKHRERDGLTFCLIQV